jgi:hypothetical protein
LLLKEEIPGSERELRQVEVEPKPLFLPEPNPLFLLKEELPGSE